MNNSGKTLTIILVVIAFLLLSLTTIAVFFFLKEVELRKVAQDNVAQLEELKAKLQVENKDIKKQIFLLEQKNKEGADKLESIVEELDLEQGLNSELKKQNKDLNDQVEREVNTRKVLEKRLTQELSKSRDDLTALQGKLDAALEQNRKLEEIRKELEATQQALMAQPVPVPTAAPEVFSPPAQQTAPAPADVDLEKIVVMPQTGQDGKVIEVDKENEFVIVSLGEKDGLVKDSVLTISRGGTVLGDIRVTQVLPDMSAADFIPPLTSKKVQKDDTVAVKSVP